MAMHCSLELNQPSEGIRPSSPRPMAEVTSFSSNEDTTSPHILASKGCLPELKRLLRSTSELGDRNENGETLLHSATRTNQVSVMQYLIDSSIDLNAVNNDGNTALHLAVTNTHIDAVHLLLGSGASDTILNKKLDAPLHIIARSNDTNLMGAFLEYPVELVISGYRKRTPLHVMSERDNLEVCEVLSRFVSSSQHHSCLPLDIGDQDQLTPIHLAAQHGSHRVLDYLLSGCIQHGYSMEALLGVLDEENGTPLHSAIAGGNLEVVKVLLKRGANPTTSQQDQPPPLHVACSQGQLEMVEAMVQQCGKEILQHTDVRGLSVLHYCWTAVNSDQMVSYLVEQGADTTLSDSYGCTALHTAILAGSLTTVKELLSNGANPLAKDNLGCNPLHLAVLHKRTTIVHALLKLPFSTQLVRELNNDGQSPIHCALRQKAGHLAMAMVSVGDRQIHGVTDKDGNTYVHIAASVGVPSLLERLLNIPACHQLINNTNSSGETPLHCAAGEGHMRCVEILLTQGAANHKSSSGMTPFLRACYRGHANCARVLYTVHPYQRDWTDDDGNSALHMAAKSGNPAVVMLTLDIGVPVTANSDQNCFFDLIIERGDTKSALAVIEHERWQECLDLHSPLRPHPMLQLIAYMPGVAKAVLDRSHTKASLDPKHPDYWEEFDFKYLQLSPESSSRGLGVTNPMLPPTKPNGDGTTPAIGTSDSLSKKRQHAVTITPLLKMVKYRRSLLLTHLVVTAFIRMKWKRYGRWIHGFQLLFEAVFLVLLSSFIVLAPSPVPQSTSTLQNGSNSSQADDDSLNLPSQVLRVILLIGTAIYSAMFIGILVSLRLPALNFVKNLWAWVFGAQIVSVFVFLIPSSPVWEAGAAACFFSWFHVLLHLQLFSFFGIYISMILTITRTVFRVLLIAAFPLAAFSFSLYILARTVPEFSEFGYSLFITYGYMVGGDPYELFVREDSTGNLQFRVLTFMMVITLTILLSIVMANLLIGLAVGDIEKIRANAMVEKVIIEVQMYSSLDASLPRRISQRLNKPFHRRYPNQRLSIRSKIWQRFLNLLQLNDAIDEEGERGALETNSNPVRVSSEDNSRELARINERLDEMAEVLKQLEEMVGQRQVLADEVSR